MDFRFYHLDFNPFVTQASDHLFWSAVHQAAWHELLERIDTRPGIVGVLGQAGVGKSTLLQTYCSSVDPKYVQVIEGIDATQSQHILLISLAQACGLTLAETNSESLFNMIYQHCRDVHTSGRQVVLLIDDAHTLSTTALGNLQALFERLHCEGESLIQIVLCGCPTLQQHCQHPDLSLFYEALRTALTLSPLAAGDRAAYIQHYLQSASTQATQIFTKGALKLIVDRTYGIPKIINITCSDVLMAGLLAGENPISAATVQSVLGDGAVRLPPIVRWGLVSAAGLLLVVGLWNMWPTTPPPSPRTASTAASQPPAPPLLTRVARTAAQMIAALRPTQAVVPEPNTPSRLPVDTPLDVQVAATDTPAAAKMARPNASSTAIRGPEQTTPVASAAFVQATSKPSTLRPSDSSEASARLDNNRQHHDSPESEARQLQQTGTRPALIASTRACLLCAMPRTNGQRGSDIVLLDHAQQRVHRLIDDGSQNMSPVLSPDGTHLAYTSYRDGAPNIYLRNLASGQETQLTSGPWLAMPSTWSPNGRYLSLSQSVRGNHDIFIYDMTRQRLRRLTQHKSIDISPSFAPDSQRLVFSSDRTGSPQLYITDIAGAPPVRLTRTGTYNTSPSWSPKDDTIAFVGRSENKALDFYTIEADGTQRQRLTQGQRFHTPPAWLPDGHILMGMSLRDEVWERHLISLNPGRAVPTLPKPESLCLAPQWVAYHAR